MGEPLAALDWHTAVPDKVQLHESAQSTLAPLDEAASCRSSSSASTHVVSDHRRTVSSGSSASSSSEFSAEVRDFTDDYLCEDFILGRGAQSTVYQATGKGSGKKYAVKSCIRSEEALKRWERLRGEAKIHSGLQHRHIARCEGVYNTNGSLHLVMECLDGGQLFERVCEKGRLKEGAAAKLVVQLLQALGHLHVRGIVHRDVKPENIMLESACGDAIKLIDFGLASRLQKGKVLKKACGTMVYTAPEVFAGSYTEKADMWSLGAVVYFVLCGKTLYHGGPKEEQRKSKYGRIDFCRQFSALSPQAQNFLRALLNRDQAKRLSVCEALAHPWLESHAKADVQAARREVIADYDAQGESTFPLSTLQVPPASSSEKTWQPLSCFAFLMPGL